MDILVGFCLGLGFAVMVFLITSENFWNTVGLGLSFKKNTETEGFIKIDYEHFVGDESIQNLKQRRKKALKRLNRFKARNPFYA